jgi:hypothetical protein
MFTSRKEDTWDARLTGLPLVGNFAFLRLALLHRSGFEHSLRRFFPEQIAPELDERVRL